MALETPRDPRRFFFGGSSFRGVAPLLAALFLLAAAPDALPAAEPLAADATRWLQGYVQVDTTNPPGNEGKAVDYLCALLEREGLGCERLGGPAGHASLLARLPATAEKSGGALLLLHHLDVVPAGPGWRYPAFSGGLHDGAVWGRGAVDAKSLGIAQVAALVALARSGLPRHRDLLLLAGADEESGGAGGVGWLWQHRPELFAGVEAVLNEGGQNKQVLGHQLWWGIEVTQKRPLWLEVVARGRPGHAAGLNPHSAVHQLVEGLARLLARPAVWKVTPAARLFLGAVADHDPNFAEIFRNLDRYILPAGPTRDLLPGMPAYFLDTVQITVLEGSDRINVVPAEARAKIDIRLLPETDSQKFLADLARVLGDDLEVSVLLEAKPAPISPRDSSTFRALVDILGQEAPVLPTFISGITDSRYFRERGIPAYGLSPFQLEGDVLRGIHGPDERLPVDELARGITRLRAILARLVSAGPGTAPR